MTPPALSVVVPSVNGWNDLAACLTALAGERADVSIEVLVPERCGAPVRDSLRKRFSWVTVLPVPPTASIPEMRAVAFDAATAPSVAVIEDHIIVPRGWARDLLIARETAPVVGGAIRNAATEHLVDWAAFLCEYSQLLPPLPAGPSRRLAGNNTVYQRELLQRHGDATHAGKWEDHLHDALRNDGVALICRPDIVVDHKKHYTLGEYLTQRYWFARSYAGTRFAPDDRWRRIAYGVGALALPPLLLWRTVSRASRKHVGRSLVWRSIPLIALFTCAWAAGELAGYWLGPGSSLSKVR